MMPFFQSREFAPHVGCGGLTSEKEDLLPDFATEVLQVLDFREKKEGREVGHEGMKADRWDVCDETRAGRVS